jgi:hypothetical protein
VVSRLRGMLASAPGRFVANSKVVAADPMARRRIDHATTLSIMGRLTAIENALAVLQPLFTPGSKTVAAPMLAGGDDTFDASVLLTALRNADANRRQAVLGAIAAANAAQTIEQLDAAVAGLPT